MPRHDTIVREKPDQPRARRAAAPRKAEGGQQPDDQDQGRGQQDEAEPKDQGGDQGGGGGKKPEQEKHSKRGLFILAGVILTLFVIGGIYAFLTRNLESTDDAYTEGDAVTIAPQVSGYVVKLNVDDNFFVHKGDVMLQIDPRDYVNAVNQAQSALNLAKAQLLAARANYEIAKVRYPAQLVQAEAQKTQAEANRFQAEREFRRQHSVDLRATTKENIDTSTAQEQSAASQVAYNQAQVNVAKLIPQNLAQAKAQVDQLEAQANQAQSQLDQAMLNLSRTNIVAVQDGWVTRRNVQLGTYLQAGQSVFELVTTGEWVVANFKETQLDRMRICQTVKLKVDAHPGITLTGRVNTIQMGSGSRFSSFPAENATGNFVKIVQRVPVKITLDRNDNLPLPLGLSVEPTVQLGSEANCTQAQKTMVP